MAVEVEGVRGGAVPVPGDPGVEDVGPEPDVVVVLAGAASLGSAARSPAFRSLKATKFECRSRAGTAGTSIGRSAGFCGLAASSSGSWCGWRCRSIVPGRCRVRAGRARCRTCIGRSPRRRPEYPPSRSIRRRRWVDVGHDLVFPVDLGERLGRRRPGRGRRPRTGGGGRTGRSSSRSTGALPRPIWWRWLWQSIRRAASRAAWTAGSNSATRMRDDRDHHQELDQGEGPSCGRGHGRRSPRPQCYDPGDGNTFGSERKEVVARDIFAMVLSGRLNSENLQSGLSRTVANRTAEIARKTQETDIRLSLDLDGQGRAEVSTGVGFLDHMLELFARHALMDLAVACAGRPACRRPPHDRGRGDLPGPGARPGAGGQGGDPAVRALRCCRWTRRW